MKINHILHSRFRHFSEAISNYLAHKWHRKFYIYLAILFTLFALLDTLFLNLTSDIPSATFDPMVQHRLIPPKPDPDIVIVDINEASLSAMSTEFGRWPWPRRVLGEFVEQVEKQHPKAIVFDIMFSDADVFNASSDAYFEEVIAKSSNTFFPMLLINQADNQLRQVKMVDIPGVLPQKGAKPDGDASVNIILPHFKAATDSGRVGTQNIILDKDGKTRNYPVYFTSSGWEIPSLPARMGREFNWPEPQTDRILLNWRGEPNTYQHVGFSEIYTDLLATEKQRPQDEFKNKIIIIGSTASNLYNVRATPMGDMYPGVELLATAIDNYKNGDSLKFPEGRLWYLLITLIIIWFTAYAFHREEGRGNIDTLFSLSQFILIGFSFASINFFDTYINLAGPVMLGIAYFTLASLYAKATEKFLEQNMVREAKGLSGDLQGTVLLVRFDGNRNDISAGTLEKIQLGLMRMGELRKSVEVMSGPQKGVWRLFEKSIMISWLADDVASRLAVHEEVQKMIGGLDALLHKTLPHTENSVHHVMHQGIIRGGEQAAEDWRVLCAESLTMRKTHSGKAT